ncbi:MAG: phosphoribosylformylglycinamidine synthase subunit PurL [bacterium]|nr:phosphoribosylformylglycinamidine synthase subunit PurL [bacterium]
MTWAKPLSLEADEPHVRPVRLFFLKGRLTEDAVLRLTETLLYDPVSEYYSINMTLKAPHSIDVTLLPGVTDPAAENLLRAAHLLGFLGLEQAATGQSYLIYDEAISSAEMERLAREVYANPVIQRYSIDGLIEPPFIEVAAIDDTVENINLKDANDEVLMQISKARRLSLDLNEMRAIRDYFHAEGRNPTDAELEMLAQTWSEHCVHKTFKAMITYTGPAHGALPDSEPVTQEIDGLLKTYIRAATEKVNKPWVRSAFVDNAGIIRFDDKWDIAFKVETHNRPSAIEPFGGANTGVGGVIRDVLGVSARPIANTDVLCFGLPDTPEDALPVGVLHPRRVAEGVVRGIEDYGNKMGIPTVNGSITYHKGYTANPLVFCGCVGILPHGSHPTGAKPGDLIVVIGGRTGRDGLRGATFSSMEMDTTTSVVSGGAVQIGHPIHEKQVQEVVLRVRDEKLYNAITDCGAGGLSSAVGEMGAAIGATAQLNTVPLKYPGLRPWEIWLSEAQERMVLAVAPEKWERLKQVCDGQDVEAVAIGVFEATGRLTLRYGDTFVGDLSMDFLHNGIPQKHLEAVWSPPQKDTGLIDRESTPEHFSETLLQLLATPNIRSNENVIRRYDHEVQGGTAVKPLVGVMDHGPSDAAVIVPLDTLLNQSDVADSSTPVRGIAIANGICPTYSEIDPYMMAWAAIDEAIRNLVAVGADPDQIAILDNFCWGNTNLPDRLGTLVRCAQGCYDAAVAYGVPFISGKDSLNNEYLGEDGQRHAIPGTLVISAIGIVPDVNKTVTMDLKQPGNAIYVVGETRDELGGSAYNQLHGIPGGTVPQPNPDAMKLYRVLHQAMQAGLIQACHDVSDGGIAVALAEMALAGQFGISLETATERSSAFYSESLSRLVVESSDGDKLTAWLEQHGLSLNPLGTVVEETVLKATASAESIGIDSLTEAWSGRAIKRPPAQPITPGNAVHAAASTKKPGVLILHANGTNRDRDAYLACEMAGGQPEIVHVNQLFAGERSLLDYHMLVVPGGFSYGDDLGAGTLWALDLRERLKDLDRFIAEGRPVIGICNGFQTLVKSGLLPGQEWYGDQGRTVTLTYNESAQFECRWVYLQPNPNSPCLFTEGLIEPIHCPVAHGEGQLAVKDEATLKRLSSEGLIALTYVDAQGQTAGYPFNPNGSAGNIAGLCNPAGNVFGLMPHPENHIFPWQHPRRTRGHSGFNGLRLFQNGIKRA